MKNSFAFLRLWVFCSALALLAGVSVAAQAASKAPERSGKTFDRAAERAQRAEIHQWLMSEQVDLGRSNPVNVPVSEAERLEIDTARGEVPERVGITKSVSRGVAFADVNLKSLKGAVLGRETGALKETDDGGYVFTAALSSPEATGIRVHFTGFRLPDNAGVYLYTEDGQVFGPYTGRGPLGDGEFWSHTLIGDEITLQLRHVGPASNADLASTSFNIAGLAHLRPRFLGGPCSYNEPCIVNLACATNVDDAVADAKNAVAHMQWISGPYIYMCSGGLLADTDTNTQIPLFLTANHCISRGKDAKSMEAFFQLTTSECSTTCDSVLKTRQDHPASLRTLGATIRATNRTGDYTLLELSEPAPGGSTFLGWDSEVDVANADGTGLFRISHPAGAPQSYSEHVVDTSYGTCSSWPRGNWIYSRDIYGATEGGSSGSPVVNTAGEVVGQLSGGCGTDVYNTCSSTDETTSNSEFNATVDGAFAAYYSDIAPILSPGSEPPPPSCTPTEVTEVSCTDGVDNDCDGKVDALDPDCASEQLLPSGAACTDNAQCLSGNCKGKPGSKVCK